MLALINGIIITPKELIRDSAVIIKDTTITDIIPNKQLSHDVVKYDCKNRFIMPDLIDTHCDCIETQIVPRKGIIFDFESALMQFDKQLLGNGITTMYHSISIANSTIVNKRRTLSVELQLKIGEMIHSIKDFLIIAHKFHARLEMNTVEAVDTIMRLINDKCIDELSFATNFSIFAKKSVATVITDRLYLPFSSLSYSLYADMGESPFTGTPF